jgi:hypothetical protein
VQQNRFYICFEFSEETEGKTGVIKYYLLQNFIEFECPDVEGSESEKADIRLHNNSALQSDPRGKHKTSASLAITGHDFTTGLTG